MSTSTEALRLSRKIHLYVGIFISPALLFFALTGAMQTFNLHESSKGSSYKPPAWIVELAQLHKKQTLEVPVRRPRPDQDARPDAQTRTDDPRPTAQDGEQHHPKSEADGTKAGRSDAAANEAAAGQAAAPKVAAASPTPAANAPQPKRHGPMKFFFLIVAVGLFTSTVTGIYMAYRYERNIWLVNGLLLAGTVIPLVLLKF
jgi:hypothetical protein